MDACHTVLRSEQRSASKYTTLETRLPYTGTRGGLGWEKGRRKDYQVTEKPEKPEEVVRSATWEAESAREDKEGTAYTPQSTTHSQWRNGYQIRVQHALKGLWAEWRI